LIQLPIFLVLYYTIRHFDTLESFRTGGLFWFQDLTQPDHLFILPVLYVLTMMASQEITIRNTAPQQAQLMRMMPLVFGAFLAFSGFPSGLFVYWITSNCITFIQNYVIYYVLPHKKPEDIEGEHPSETEKNTSPAMKNGAANGKVPQNHKPAQPQKMSGRAKNRKKKKVAKRR
jgi:YidC/Oxa1 family membrane protein insertase